MAPRKNIDRSKVPAEMLAKAREAALAKQARIMAEQELGIGDTDLPTQKGPLNLSGEVVEVKVDLAEFQDRLVIDSVHYMNGRTYTLPIELARVVKEQMARSWRHQAEIEGKDKPNFYIEHRMANTAVRLSPRSGAQRVAI